MNDTQPEAAHAASEYPDTTDRPEMDGGPEMLGRLLVYAVIVVIGCIGLASALAGWRS